MILLGILGAPLAPFVSSIRPVYITLASSSTRKTARRSGYFDRRTGTTTAPYWLRCEERLEQQLQ